MKNEPELKEQKEVNESLYPSLDIDSYNGSEPYIFISYSHLNTNEVYQILKQMDTDKFRIWYDDTMEVGEDFRDELRIKIEKCSAFVLFISKESMESKYCCMEVITAFKNNKKIYPVYLQEKVKIPPAFTMILENLQHVKGWIGDGTNKYVKKFLSSLPIETMRSLEIENGVLTQCRDGGKTVTVPDGVHTVGAAAFKNCEQLIQVAFGNGLEVIRKEAFRGCKNLTELELPENVRQIGESAFRDCIAVTSLIIRNNDIEVGERAFENCAQLSNVELPMCMTEIYGGVFNSCKALESVLLPTKLTIIGESAFADCVKLKEVTIPDCVTKIDDMAFNGCVELEQCAISESVTKIGKNTFKDCQKIEYFHIPHSVLNIGSGPFRGCSRLKSISVDSKNRYFKSVDNILFNKNKSTLICYPSQIDKFEYAVPDSVTLICDWAFCECSKLNRITIPDSVYEIGEGAFYMCTSLRSMIVPDSVVKIDDIAFRGCCGLETIVIPDSVTDFGWGVFNGCDKITVICTDTSAAAQYCDSKNIPHRAEF